MADEEVVEEELEDGDAESDLDSLMSEVEAKESAEDSGVGGDLSSLVSDSSEEKSQDLDSMLSSAQQVSISEDQEEEGMSLDLLLEMPLTVTFEVGRAKMPISDLLSLGQGSVLDLHRLVGESLDLFVNNRLIARGEVVVINEKFGARLPKSSLPKNGSNAWAGWTKSVDPPRTELPDHDS